MSCHRKFDCSEMFQGTFHPKGFVIKSVLFLFIICAPGNLITTILLYKHWSSIDEITNITNETNPTGATYDENALEDNSTPLVSFK